MDSSIFKGFADDNLNVAQMVKFVIDRVENIVGKVEYSYLSYKVFKSLLPQMELKIGIDKGKIFNHIIPSFIILPL